VIDIDQKYKPIQTSDARYYIVTGGRGSGKSYLQGLHYRVLTFLLYQNL